MRSKQHSFQFGKVVAILRKEQWDEDGNRWTQGKLAQESGLTINVISQIETGRKTTFKFDDLLRLANALQLTVGERKEFFLLASEMQEVVLKTHEEDLDEILAIQLSLLRRMQLPAILIDQFCNVVAVNKAYLHAYNIDVEYAIVNLQSSVVRPNILHFMFHVDFEIQRKMMGHRYSEYAETLINVFRVLTLRYRWHPEVQKLIQSLSKNPKFRSVWQTYRTSQTPSTFDNQELLFEHPVVGTLKFVTSTITTTTESGDLKLYSFIPLDQNTQESFNDFSETPTVYELAAWPILLRDNKQ